MILYTFVLFFGYLALFQEEVKVDAKNLPSYLTPCSISDPQLNECFKQHGDEAISIIMKGDPDYKLSPLVPFHLEKVELKPSSQLTLILTDLKLWGLDGVKITGVSFDLKNQQLKLNLYAKYLKIESHYNISGTILVLPIQGEGSDILEFEEGNLEYTVNYDLIKINDKEYFHNLKPKVTFEVGHASYKLNDLFNGNKQLSDNTNKILNENWREVLKDFGLAISEIVAVVITKVLNAYFEVVPYDEIFLP